MTHLHFILNFLCWFTYLSKICKINFILRTFLTHFFSLQYVCTYIVYLLIIIESSYLKLVHLQTHTDHSTHTFQAQHPRWFQMRQESKSSIDIRKVHSADRYLHLKFLAPHISIDWPVHYLRRIFAVKSIGNSATVHSFNR